MKTKEEVLELQLNYLETAFILGKKSSDIKCIYEEIIGGIVNSKIYIKVPDLVDIFNSIRSLDMRYDGENELVFSLMYKSRNYRKYLGIKSVAKNRKFTGGKSVFMKIMNEDQLSHFNRVIEERRKFFNIK